MQFVSNLLGGILFVYSTVSVRGGKFFFGWITRGRHRVGMNNLNLAKDRETWVVERARYIYLYFLAYSYI